MAKLSEESKKIISEVSPAQVATASREGKPNVSPKGSFRVLDDEHVAFADVRSPRTIANLRENPQVSVIVFDAANRKGCRIWGKAEILETGDLFDAFQAQFEPRNIKINCAVKIAVEEEAIISVG
ncbi:pyridoxamine 5'-phosphate oxidase family protein [Chloroflexota bacterium]